MSILESGLDFKWTQTEVGANYWLEVATDSGFNELYKYRKIDSSLTTYDDFNAGNYFWRVRVENPIKGTILSTNSRLFTVTPLPTLKSPVIVRPTQLSTVLMDYVDSLDFEWEDVKGAKYYEIVCFSEAGDVIFEKKSVKNNKFSFLKLEMLDIGQFYYTIKAVGYIGIKKIEINSKIVRVDFKIGLNSDIEVPDILSPEIQYAQ